METLETQVSSPLTSYITTKNPTRSWVFWKQESLLYFTRLLPLLIAQWESTDTQKVALEIHGLGNYKAPAMKAVRPT